jgi:hypothetical protein
MSRGVLCTRNKDGPGTKAQGRTPRLPIGPSRWAMNGRDLFLRIRALVARRRVERELGEELSFHIERESAIALSPDHFR